MVAVAFFGSTLCLARAWGKIARYAVQRNNETNDFQAFFSNQIQLGLDCSCPSSDNASVHCVVSDTFLFNFFVELGPARNSPSCNQKKVDKKSN